MIEEDKIITVEKEPKPENNLSDKKMKMLYWGLGAGLVVVVVLVIGGFSYRALNYLAVDKPTVFLTKAISLPAGYLNGRAILYSNFAEDVPAVERFYQKQMADGSAPSILSKEEIRKSVWNRLVKNALVESMAERISVRVAIKDIEVEYQSFVTNTGTKEAAEKLISDNYGWTPAQFKTKVIKQFLLQDKVATATSTIDLLEKDVKVKADAVYQEAKDGKKSFEDLAKQYGEDGTKDKGGDLDWFGKGVMIPEFEVAIAKLTPGQVDVVKTSFGFHIIKLEGTKEVKGEIQWHARHILLRTVDFNQYLTNELQKAKIWKWLKI